MTAAAYQELRRRVTAAGFGEEIAFYQDIPTCGQAQVFFSQYCWVVLNSGMKNQVALLIRDRVAAALREGRPVREAFGHPGKAAAIQHVWDEREAWFSRWQACPPADRVAFLGAMPWIGPITKWHLAKNLGHDCAKPDRHLVRIAAAQNVTVDDLCAALAQASGDRMATVDYVLWRAANLGWL